MFKPVTAWKRYTHYITSIRLVDIPLPKSLSYSLSCSLSLTCRLLLRPWAICPAHQMWLLTPLLPQQYSLSGCPQLLGLLFILATIAPSHDWIMPASLPYRIDAPWALFFIPLVETFQRKIMMRWMFPTKGLLKGRVRVIYLTLKHVVQYILTQAGENVAVGNWVSSKRCINSFVLH